MNTRTDVHLLLNGLELEASRISLKQKYSKGTVNITTVIKTKHGFFNIETYKTTEA